MGTVIKWGVAAALVHHQHALEPRQHGDMLLRQLAFGRREIVLQRGSIPDRDSGLRQGVPRLDLVAGTQNQRPSFPLPAKKRPTSHVRLNPPRERMVAGHDDGGDRQRHLLRGVQQFGDGGFIRGLCKNRRGKPQHQGGSAAEKVSHRDLRFSGDFNRSDSME
jgi:hypothetical protein